MFESCSLSPSTPRHFHTVVWVEKTMTLHNHVLRIWWVSPRAVIVCVISPLLHTQYQLWLEDTIKTFYHLEIISKLWWWLFFLDVFSSVSFSSSPLMCDDAWLALFPSVLRKHPRHLSQLHAPWLWNRDAVHGGSEINQVKSSQVSSLATKYFDSKGKWHCALAGIRTSLTHCDKV